MLALSWFIYKCQSPFWEIFKLLVIWWNHLGNILFNMPYSTKPLFFSSLKVFKYTCFVNISKGGMINLDSPICQVYLLRLFRKDRVVWTLYPINTLLDVNVMFLENDDIPYFSELAASISASIPLPMPLVPETAEKTPVIMAQWATNFRLNRLFQEVLNKWEILIWRYLALSLVNVQLHWVLFVMLWVV